MNSFVLQCGFGTRYSRRGIKAMAGWYRKELKKANAFESG